METIIREVNPARLAWGTFDHAKSDYVNEGDIPASYSGDCIAMGQPVRKPFRMDGEMWLAIGLSNDGARAYRLCPMRVFNGTPTTYHDKSGSAERAEEARNDPNGFYDRMTVKHGAVRSLRSRSPDRCQPARGRFRATGSTRPLLTSNQPQRTHGDIHARTQTQPNDSPL
jgi:hypothetical protein